MLLNSWCVASIDLSIRRWASARKSSIAAIRRLLGGRDDRAHALACRDPADVPLRQLEDIDRQTVVHAQAERNGVHHSQAPLDRLEVRELRNEACTRVLSGIAVVDALDCVLAHEDRLCPDLERTERRRGV